jgi:hypothetical protein
VRFVPVASKARALIAVVAWSGVLLQLVLSVQLAVGNGKSPVSGLVAYFGYFTVLTNLLVALVLSVPLFVAGGRVRRFLGAPDTLACACASVSLVGLAYHVLLRHVWDPEGAQWLADVLLHYVTPLLYAAWWVLAAPRPALRWWSPFLWCLYPAGYLAYALVRGAWLQSYPYPFIDVAALGPARVFVNALGLMAVFIVVAWVLVGLKQLIGKART